MTPEGNRPNIRDLEQPGDNGMKLKFYRALTEFEDTLPEGTFLDWCENTLAGGASLRTISVRVGVAHGSLGRFLRNYGVGTLSQSEASRRVGIGLHQDPQFTARLVAAGNEASKKKWEDPEFRKRRSEEVKKQWEDPEFRESVTNSARQNAANTILNPAFDEKRIAGNRKAVAERWADPEYRQRETARLREVTLDNWTDPEFRKKQSEKMLQQWEDPEFRAQHTERNSAAMSLRWQDPDYRAGMLAQLKAYRDDPAFRAASVERTLKRWAEDEGYRNTVAEALRRSTEERIQLGLLPLSSVHGLRRDLGFYAFSTWEANLARVFAFMNWAYQSRVPFELEVPDEFQEKYGMPATSIFHLDFLTLSPGDRLRGTEIMVHPYKNPIGWAKVRLFREQHPEIPLRLISDRYYGRLERGYRDLIEADSRFCGWETKEDNLFSNPDKFA